MGECIKKAQNVAKGDYVRTRAIEFKHLPALNLSNFFCEYPRFMLNKVKEIKKIKF